MATFPFAVPSLSDVNRKLGFTVDWCTYKLLNYVNGGWVEVCSLRSV